MSSVYGYFSSSISKSSRASLGISGLASGVDVDATVEAMSSGTNSKISKVKQNLMKLEWKQSAYQEIGTLLTDFKDKYMSKTGASSISNLLANCYNITAEGDNADAVSATGSPNILNNFSILAVKSLASTSAFTSKSGVTKPTLSSDAINFSSDPVKKSTLEGKKLSISIGSDKITLEFDDTVITDDASLETALKNAISKSDADQKIKDKLAVKVEDGKITFSNTDSTSTENITINSKSSNATLLKVLGLKPKAQVGEGNTGTVDRNGTTVTSDAVDFNSMTKEVSFFKNLESGNKKFTLDLDGTKATVEFNKDMLDAIKKAGTDAAAKGEDANKAMATELTNQINNQLKRVYGDKVKAEPVELGTDKDGNKTYGFQLNVTSSNSILSVASGDSDIVGSSGVLGINVGDANRLLLGSKLDEANFANGFDFGDDGTKTYDLNINGVSFTIGKDSITIDGNKTDYKNGVTMNHVIAAVNSSNANVTMSYLSTTDKFTVTSTVSGASGKVEISGSFADNIFGDGSAGTGTIDETHHAGGVYTNGTDAKMLVSFDGGNTMEEITRSSNSFKLDGLNLTIKETFNDSVNIGDDISKIDNKVTFSKSVNKEDLTNAIKEMVDDYNEIIAKVMDYYKTRPDRDYQPLTEDMIKNEELSEDQANLYNDEAKKGILFGDSILRSLSNDMRTIFTGLSGIGISTSSDYKEYGKLSFDAEKFGAALEADAAGVAERFTNAGTGVLAKLDTLMDKYVNSSIAKPGLITQKSGLANSSLTQMNSLMFKEKDALNKQLKELKVKLKSQQDRYYSRFTAMEVALSKLNSQSGYLQSMMGSM